MQKLMCQVGSSVSAGSSTSETLLALSVCRHIDWQLFGHTGTREEYVSGFKALKAGFVEVNTQGHMWDSGPLNHARPFSAALATQNRRRERRRAAKVALRQALLVDLQFTQGQANLNVGPAATPQTVLGVYKCHGSDD